MLPDVWIGWTSTPRRGRTVGARVRADGRYESLADVEVGVGRDGEVTLLPTSPAWKEVFRYTSDELVVVRGLLADVPPRPSPAPAAAGGEVVRTWWVPPVWGDDPLVIVGHPAAALPALESVWQAVVAAHRWPAETSRWTVSDAHGTTTRTVTAAVTSLPWLQPLLALAYMAPGTSTSAPPSGTAWVSVHFLADGADAGTTTVWTDGTVTESDTTGADVPLRRLTPGAIDRFRTAVEVAALHDRPEPVCAA